VLSGAIIYGGKQCRVGGKGRKKEKGKIEADKRWTRCFHAFAVCRLIVAIPVKVSKKVAT
jgi:hypothetical protein